MMENASGSGSSASFLQRPSVSPQILNNESPLLEPMAADAKALPRNYSECEFGDLVELIGRMLMQLMSINVHLLSFVELTNKDQIPISPEKLTRFHSRATPAISVTEYLLRIVRYSSLEKPTLLATVFYIDLLSRCYPAFTLSSLTVHRFLITGVTVASKGLCDAFCTNTHYAKVGGIGVAELNMLELEFLKKVDWQIVPQPSVLEAYYQSMISQDPRYCIEPEINASRHDMLSVDMVKTARSLSNSEDEQNPKLLHTDVAMDG